MLNEKRLIGTVLAAALLLTPACSAPLTKNWGRSFENQKSAQALDPEAGREPRPVEGLSAGAATRTVEAYENSFGQKSEGGSDTEGGDGMSMFEMLSAPIVK